MTSATSSCTVSSAAATDAATNSGTILAATGTGATAMTIAIATTTATAATFVTAATSRAVKKSKPYLPEQRGGRKKVSKCIIVDQCVEKFEKYGLYNDLDMLHCKPCAQRVDHEREDSITHHILRYLHHQNCAKHIANGAPYVLVRAYEEREERRVYQTSLTKI